MRSEEVNPQIAQISQIRNVRIRSLLFGCAAVGLVLCAAFLPLDWLDRFPALCLFRNLTGHPCPGCGMTHAIVALLHGDLSAALACNRLVIVVFPLLCYCLAGIRSKGPRA